MLRLVSRVPIRYLDNQFGNYHALNTNAATTVSYVTGPTFGVVSAITPPAIARIGVSFKF